MGYIHNEMPTYYWRRHGCEWELDTNPEHSWQVGIGDMEAEEAGSIIESVLEVKWED